MKEIILELQRTIIERAEISKEVFIKYYHLAEEHQLLVLISIMLALVLFLQCSYFIREVTKIKKRHTDFKLQLKKEVRNFRNSF